MQRKRRAALLAAVLLVLAFLPVGLLLSRAAGEMLMVADDNILTPVKEQMPFETGGLLYVPVVLFDKLNATVTIRPSSITLAMLSRAVMFDLAEDLAYDERENTYMAKAIYKNGVWFVPSKFTADRLDLDYTWNKTAAPAGFVRIGRPGVMTPAERFLRAYPGKAQPIWDAYLRAQTSSVPPTSPGSSAPDTTIPPFTPPFSTPVATSAPLRYRVFLLFDGLAFAKDALSHLQAVQALATFRVTPTDIAEQPALIRRIAAAGHSFAFAVDTPAEAEQAASALFLLCKKPVYAAAPPESAAKNRAALEAAGFSVWQTTLTLDGGATNQDFSVLQSFLNRRPAGALVLITPGAHVGKLIDGILHRLRGEGPSYFPILPIDAPVLP